MKKVIVEVKVLDYEKDGDVTLDLQEDLFCSPDNVMEATRVVYSMIESALKNQVKMKHIAEATEKWGEMQVLDLIACKDIEDKARIRIGVLEDYLEKYRDVISQDRIDTINYLIETYNEIKFCATCKLTKAGGNDGQ
ncbi:hypothetical protein [Veillonella intestinalis]|uniref:hypothetical protein n=1 Tax=Veillonella intestinalis TaxID=2941341 RepID=UPI00204146EA|nr:hypothetical protein [Veillonella intestinalis]